MASNSIIYLDPNSIQWWFPMGRVDFVRPEKIQSYRWASPFSLLSSFANEYVTSACFFVNKRKKDKFPFARWAHGKRIEEIRLGFHFPFSVWFAHVSMSMSPCPCHHVHVSMFTVSMSPFLHVSMLPCLNVSISPSPCVHVTISMFLVSMSMAQVS